MVRNQSLIKRDTLALARDIDCDVVFDFGSGDVLNVADMTLNSLVDDMLV